MKIVENITNRRKTYYSVVDHGRILLITHNRLIAENFLRAQTKA